MGFIERHNLVSAWPHAAIGGPAASGRAAPSLVPEYDRHRPRFDRVGDRLWGGDDVGIVVVTSGGPLCPTQLLRED
jgi:hypothetical protein